MDEKMFCPQCRLEGQKSRVYLGHLQQTLMMPLSFWDEDGRFHIHNSNITTTYYSCSKGHEWQEKESGGCWCGWPDSAVAVTPQPRRPDGIAFYTDKETLINIEDGSLSSTPV